MSTTSQDDIAATIAARPLPEIDGISQAYWAAAERGELLYQVCPDGHRQLYPRALCATCGAEPSWARASGRGAVHTFTVIRQNGAEPFKRLVPYVVAVVELEEGPRMMTNIVDCDPDDMKVGMAVEVCTATVEVGLGIPFWRPAGGRG